MIELNNLIMFQIYVMVISTIDVTILYWIQC